MYRFQQRVKNLKRKAQNLQQRSVWKHLSSPKGLMQTNEVQLTIIKEGRNKDLAQKEEILKYQIETRQKQEKILLKPKSRIR